MKSKVTLFLILSVTLNIYLIIIYTKLKSSFLPPPNNKAVVSFGPALHGSSPISRSETKCLVNEYINGPHYRLPTKDPDHPTNFTTLRGLIFDANNLREIVDTNKSGTTPDKVVLYFGFEEKSNEYHIIAIGADKNGTLLDYNPAIPTADAEITKNISVFDKADPCTKCVPK